MKKRFLCILVATALLLGILTGCGNSSTGSSDSDKPGVGSTESDKGGHADDDSVAVMKERVKAVNSAINYECIGLMEAEKEGLLFYNLIDLITGMVPSPDGDYNPDKPLDYYVSFLMRKAHTEGVVSEDTYVALLKKEMNIREVVASDVIETDDLYVYYHSYLSAYLSTLSDPNRTWSGPTGVCYILVKGTDIVYSFSVQESWAKPNYFKCSFQGGSPHISELVYASDDAEYIFTDEFWQAFAQTVKFVGNADEDFEEDKGTGIAINTQYQRDNSVKIPYVEGWYVGGTWSRGAIREGFESFVKNFLENREAEAVFYFDDGTEKRYPAIKDGYAVTIDLGNGQVWRYEYGGDNICLFSSGEPDPVTGERPPKECTLIYKNDIPSLLVIDDFGQGEPTMFFNNGLYKYASNGEVTLIHDFSKDVDVSWRAMTIDAGRTHLMFSDQSMDGEDMTVIDLKTFEIADSISLFYEVDENGIRGSAEGMVNGVSVDETAARDAYDRWYSDDNIELADRIYGEETDFDSAWNAYESRG